MSVIVLLVMIYVGLYVVLSVPAVQNKMRLRICSEASAFLGGELRIGSLSISPFSEVKLTDVILVSPDGERCVNLGKVAAGIDVWSLIADRKIVLNYAEIIGLDVRIVQPTPHSALNIQFLIDALSPKDKAEPPARYRIKIRNVIVRDSKASFSRPWMTDTDGKRHRLADIALNRLRMDLSIPELSNLLFRFDIRKIQFDMTPGLNVRDLSADVTLLKDPAGISDRLMIDGLNISLPNTHLAVGDLDLRLDSIERIDAVVHGSMTPADLASFLPQLDSFQSPWNVAVDASLNGRCVYVSELRLDHSDSGSHVGLIGSVNDFGMKDSLEVEVKALDAYLSSGLISDLLAHVPSIGDKGKNIIRSLGTVGVEFEGALRAGGAAVASGKVSTEGGNIGFNMSGSRLFSRQPVLKLSAVADGIDLDLLSGSEKIGSMSASIEGEVEGLDRNAEGWLNLTSDECMLMGNHLKDVDLELRKKGADFNLTLDASSQETTLNLGARAHLAGKDSRMSAHVSVNGFNPASFGMKGKMADCDLSGHVSVNVAGDNADNVTGRMEMHDVSLKRRDGRGLGLKELIVSIDPVEPEGMEAGNALIRDIRVQCDWLEAHAYGRLLPSSVSRDLKQMAASVIPTLIPESMIRIDDHPAENDFILDIDIKGTSAPYEFFNMPLRPLTDITVKGSLESSSGKASLSLSTPHLLQGKNKLISDVDLKVDMDSFLGMAKVRTGFVFPAKKGDAEISAGIYALHDKVSVDIGINPTIESSVKGSVAMTASFTRLPDPFHPQGTLAVNVNVVPSSVVFNEKAWSIADGSIDYSGQRISVSNFLISHDNQFVRIAGTASESPDDLLKVTLNDIDLEYIFNILNINYVSFGGMASGVVTGSKLLTKEPKAYTEFLKVKGLSYNGAVLGDGDLASDYHASARKVGIYAVIRDPLTRERRASVDGGIWVTRDSLSFGFDANRLNAGILKPFVSAFCSDLYGEASGKCKLYGNFSDIDLTGALKADTLSMKLDFTNTWYHAGQDSVFLYKGVIDVPPLTLYDDERHSAEFSGWLKHTYFHDPVFNFRLRNAQSLLCYNTDEKMNPLWYGTIYGSGHAQITGYPGIIDIDMNMTTEDGSKFYYVISDAEDVDQYSFLSFTDRRKTSRATASADSVPDYLLRFRKQTDDNKSESSNVVLSLKGTVTNDALVTLVMDPRAGDNITARGQGALQMDYNLASNDLRMIGTYVLDEGNYNFTLQDIIIKNFNIRRGSLIKFDGDPMKANLDITATYRVNTNLTDLDESFSTDKELNRTNVPVDAVLLVDGPMTNPDISFDIELPSLTSDVERKVKSIVSTNDMMSRQIIYLLALNRFYTPEYTSGQNTGSEWSSVASSTISSQLSNIFSQMTDKLDVAPSFRSEKGDFTDMEFDLALSSRLLNNRLLINGNFGYRDRSTSNTQFIGDFDIEYLLNKSGNLRLKAYNHFNDQNYYLRSALTTQGVGVVFRRDFDRLFRRKKTWGEADREKADSVKTDGDDLPARQEKSFSD